MNYSSFGTRLLASVMDSLICFILSLGVGMVIPYVGGVLVFILYKPILESSKVQATLGKRMMKIKVCDLSGNQITLKAALIRSMMHFVSSIVFCLGHLVMFLNDKKQNLHDKLADTLVIEDVTPYQGSLLDAWIDQLKTVVNKV
jgi:uncharacterized RDD family membrane protein YckC